MATGFSGVRRGENMPHPVETERSEPEPIRLADLQLDPSLEQLNEADLPTFLRRTFPSR